MAIKKIKRIVTQPPQSSAKTQPAAEKPKAGKLKKKCLFCQNKSNPIYTDLGNLKRFLTDRAKIVARERSGACSKHQRAITKNIKYARHLSLLPFVPKV